MHIQDQSKPTSILTYFLILSLLLHALLLLSATIIWVNPVEIDKSGAMEVPAYVYHEDNSKSGTAGLQKQEQQQEVTSKQGTIVEKPIASKPIVHDPHPAEKNVVEVSTKEEPIHLIGDKNTPPKPLAKIIGRALAKTLVYPKIAVDFRVKGIVYVGFSIHPDGSLTEIKVVQSSHAGVLDEAALAAVKKITPLQNVATYVSKPRFLVIGIIFR